MGARSASWSTPGTFRVRAYDPARRERRKDNPSLDHGIATGRNAVYDAADTARDTRPRDGKGRLYNPMHGEAELINLDWELSRQHLLDPWERWSEGRRIAHEFGTDSAEYLEWSETKPASRQDISEWSRKSRSRFHETVAKIDWEPFFGESGIPCMVTLTYPGLGPGRADRRGCQRSPPRLGETVPPASTGGARRPCGRWNFRTAGHRTFTCS